MLKEIFRTTPIKYRTDTGPDPFVNYRGSIKKPYRETLSRVASFYVVEEESRFSPHQIQLYCLMGQVEWPSWGVRRYSWDSVTGQEVKTPAIPSSIGSGSIAHIIRTVRGAFWIVQVWTWYINSGARVPDGWVYTGTQLNYTDFDPYAYWGGACGIDEDADVMITSDFDSIKLWKWSTRTGLPGMQMPGDVSQIAMEDPGRAYILCKLSGYHMVVLVDYFKREVLGASRLPVPPVLKDYAIAMTWDWKFRRLLIFYNTPNTPAGACTSYVRGYRLVPYPTRITKPIPLRVPRLYRTIPVMTQVVGHLNEGVGGNLVRATVTGSGVLAGIPMTDHMGVSFVPVLCTRGASSIDVRPEIPPPGAPPIVAPAENALWFGYFFQYSTQYGDNLAAPSNAAYVQDAEKVAVAVDAGKAVVVGGNAIAAAVGYEDHVIGLWIAGGTEDELEARAATLRAGLPESLASKPIIGNFDGGQRMPTRPVVGCEWLALECYVGSGETADQCEARVQACLDLLGAAHQYLLIGQSYTSNTNNTSDPAVLQAAQVIPSHLANTNSRVQAILMFSDGRPTGTRDHEEWRPAHQSILDGIADTPAIP